jgi:hypothetical protein
LSKGGAVVIIVFRFTNCHSLKCEENDIAKGLQHVKKGSLKKRTRVTTGPAKKVPPAREIHRQPIGRRVFL